jgi:hypothetical protein
MPRGACMPAPIGRGAAGQPRARAARPGRQHPARPLAPRCAWSGRMKRPARPTPDRTPTPRDLPRPRAPVTQAPASPGASPRPACAPRPAAAAMLLPWPRPARRPVSRAARRRRRRCARCAPAPRAALCCAARPPAVRRRCNSASDAAEWRRSAARHPCRARAPIPPRPHPGAPASPPAPAPRTHPAPTRPRAPPPTAAVCIVTGGSRGIGAAIAQALGAQGARVVVNYASSPAKAEEVADAIVKAVSRRAPGALLGRCGGQGGWDEGAGQPRPRLRRWPTRSPRRCVAGGLE